MISVDEMLGSQDYDEHMRAIIEVGKVYIAKHSDITNAGTTAPIMVAQCLYRDHSWMSIGGCD